QRHRRGRRNDFRKPREGAPADATATPVAAVEGAPATEARPERPPRERFEGKGRDGDRRDKFDRNKGDRNKGGGRDKGERGGRDFGGRDKGGRDKRDSGPSHRQWATSAAPRERDRPVDPNSPFAKLAALKEQLAGRKEEPKRFQAGARVRVQKTRQRVSREIVWSGSVSISGCGTRGW